MYDGDAKHSLEREWEGLIMIITFRCYLEQITTLHCRSPPQLSRTYVEVRHVATSRLQTHLREVRVHRRSVSHEGASLAPLVLVVERHSIPVSSTCSMPL